MNHRAAATVAALAELLCRRCIELPHAGDAESAQLLLNALVQEEGPLELLAVAAGGVWAAYRPAESLSEELITAALDCARALLGTEIGDTERSLASAALGLLAVRGAGEQPAVDLVNVAVSARRVEQHDVALWAAEQALGRREDLSPSHETMALLTAAVITRDPETTRAAYEKARWLPPDDLAARSAESLRPTLHPDGTWTLRSVGDAVRDQARPAAAASLATEIAGLRGQTDDDLLAGLHRTLTALSTDDIDVESARAGLMLAIGHLRRRQRFGRVPPVARAGLDIVADLLSLATTAAAASVLTELVEALADAGLSELVELPGDDVPAIAQARLMELAQDQPLWPDLRRCVEGLGGKPALLLRRQRMLSADQLSVLGLFVEPPDGLAIKKSTLDVSTSRLVDQLAKGEPAAIAAIDAASIDELIIALLPAGLIRRATDGRLESLLVVPDGPLWSIPWQAASLFSRTQVTVAPSLAVHAGLALTDAPFRHVTAVIDDNAPSAALVVDALQEARAGGLLDVKFRDRVEPGPGCDLLVVFAHGAGTGLQFRTGSASQPVSALALATSAQARAALVAACWSAAAPPVAFPLSLPAAMLLSGVPTVIGGLWPLPGRPTAEIISATISGIARHGRLDAALTQARAAAEPTVLARWGLAVHGAMPISS